VIAPAAPLPQPDPLWYKDAIIYEVHVRAFFDSNDDGMGDFPGLTAKLDYLHDLGVTAIWLLPFCPSPWKDDGYDISDFTGVHPAYGTLKDFQIFLKEAHRRGLKVITELVLNHTSDQHEWFQRSRRAAPGSQWREYYVWNNTPDLYKGARIIFQDFETSNWTWDPVAKAYFWHRFYSHQPDLNFDSPAVRRAVLRVLDFWANLGVDGFRLDAVPYLFEREGTNCENLPETHAFLKEIRAHLDTHFPGRMLLSEANMWPEDAVHYMGDGDECQMSFHFPLMPRLFMANRLEDRFPIIEIMNLTPPIPETAQWALFLRNHDELTLEMVTDEERDYMYRTYADDRKARINLGIRRRLAPLLNDNRRKIELMNGLLFSLPGTPVLYYGDEIGMGDNFYLGDRNGVRTPMQWSSDRNAGFSRANPQRLYLPIVIDPEYHYEARNVEAQQGNPNSLLWWNKRLIRLRKQHKAFGRGTLEFLNPDNRRVLAFYRKFGDEVILVVANLSRFVQPVALNLSEFAGFTPVEMFGGTEFPLITDHLYLLTLGPSNFYWFSVEKRTADVSTGTEGVLRFTVSNWAQLWSERAVAELVRALPRFLTSREWFLSKDRRIRQVAVHDFIPIRQESSYIAIARIEYSEGEPELYGLPLSLGMDAKAEDTQRDFADYILAEVENAAGGKAVIYGALWDRDFCNSLLEAVARRRKFRGGHGEVVAWRNANFRALWGSRHPNLEPYRLKTPQRNSSVVYGDRFILKMFRRLEEGTHPEVKAADLPHSAQLAGGLEYRTEHDEPITLAVLHGYVPHEGTALDLSRHSLSRFLVEAQLPTFDQSLLGESRHPLELANEEVPTAVRQVIGDYIERIEILGRYTGDIHIALARNPEPFTDFYRRSLYHSMIALAQRVLPSTSDSSKLDRVRRVFHGVDDPRINGQRIRLHGDLNLDQVLDTGKDFIFIDFEGDPAKHLTERRIKRSGFRDIAQMLLSFNNVAVEVEPGHPEPGELEPWRRIWLRWTLAAYLRGYSSAVKDQPFMPSEPDAVQALLNAFVLQQMLEEMRAGKTNVPLERFLDLVSSPSAAK
jgi:maltose alpha-D-glucosyltransferase / alpha-amylase